MPLRPTPPRPPETYTDLIAQKYVLALHYPACDWAASSDDGTEMSALSSLGARDTAVGLRPKSVLCMVQI